MKNVFAAAVGKQDLASRISNQILALLDKGVRAWAQPWENGNTARILRPLRSNGAPYGGINTLMLWLAAHEHGFTNPNWMTYRQADALGAHVMKGEHATPVVYASTITKNQLQENGENLERHIPFMNWYKFFAAQQSDGLPDKYYDKAPSRLDPNERIQRAEEFFASTGAEIHHGGNKAFYAMQPDYIRMPEFGAFQDPESYYATLAHEITHWTRHPSRLARDFGRAKFGDEGYAKEEIVAEIGSAILCSELDLTPEPREENASYIDHWKKLIKGDKNFILKAAAHAQRAADFIISAHQAPVVEQNNEHEHHHEQEAAASDLQPGVSRALPRPGM
jgi:antirestriction protein ArdC